MTTEDSGLRRNPLLLCAFQALQMSLFPVAVITLFWKQSIGMNLTTMLSVQAFFGIVLAAFEVPSGYLADRLGYRKALLYGAAIVMVGWGLYSLARSLAEIIVVEAVLGVGFSLISGSDVALLYESLVQSGEEENFRVWYGRMRFYGQIGEGTSALVAGILFAIWDRLPFVLETGIWVAALGVAWPMTEPATPGRKIANHWKHIGKIVRVAAVENPRLRSVIVLATVLSLASYIPVWLVPLYAVDAGVNVAWLGPFWAIANYAVALGALFGARFESALGQRATLLGCCVLVAIGYLGLGLTLAPWGVSFYLAITLMRGVNPVILHDEEQRLIDSGDRASFVSVRSLVFRVVVLVAAPLVGAAAERYGQHAVLVVFGGLMTALSLAALGEFSRSREQIAVPALAARRI